MQEVMNHTWKVKWAHPSPTPSHTHFFCCFQLYLKTTHPSKTLQFSICQGCTTAPTKKMDNLWEMPLPLTHSLSLMFLLLTKDSSGNSHHLIWASRFMLESTETHKTQDHISINCSRQANCMLDKLYADHRLDLQQKSK